MREDSGDGVVVPQASLIEGAATRRVRVLSSLKDVAVWALAVNVGVGLGLAVSIDGKKAEARRSEEPKDAGREERGLGDPLVGGGGSARAHTPGRGMVPSQAPRQRVGDECRRRLMGMLPCAMDSSAAPSAALASATERPSAVSAAIAEWGMVPQTPTAIATSGSKVHECGSRAPGTRRSIEAHGFRRSHGSYLACLRPITCGSKQEREVS